MKIACLQTNPQEVESQNLELIFDLAREAKKNGAECIVFPEMFSYMGDETQRTKLSSNISDGVFLAAQKFAEKNKVFLVAGSHPEYIPESNKVYNTSMVFSPEGEQLSFYRKRHLFNLKDEMGNPIYCESDVYSEGQPPTTYFLKDSAHETWNATTIICYDLRFPEILRLQISPLDMVFVPAAFTWQTGQDHWEVLLRARAIENQCYIIACNQTGFFANGQKRVYGNSMVVDPWGHVVSRLGEEVGILYAQLDKSKIQSCRTRLPAWADKKR